MSGMSYGNEFQPSLRDLANSALLPTLKRWAIVVRSLRDGISRRVSDQIPPRHR